MLRAFSSTACSSHHQHNHPLLSLLEKCCNMRPVMQIHAQTITLGLSRFTYVTSRIFAFCATNDYGDLSYAHLLFDRMLEPTIFNWNTMIKGYSKSPDPETGLLMYVQMRSKGILPNMHTFPFTVRSCGNLLQISQVHGHIIKFAFDLDVYVISSLIKGYSICKCLDSASLVFSECGSHRNLVCWTSLISGFCYQGVMDKAKELFDSMPEKNDVAWSALISGYVQNEWYKEALEVFRQLRTCKTTNLNGSLVVSVLKACAALNMPEEGRWIHSYIDKNKLDYGLKLGTALVDFYAKCGFLGSAKEVFDKMRSKDVTAWSAMITGSALHGHSKSALHIFSEMLNNGVKPNEVTFIGVLTACSHGGLVKEGQAYFEEMQKTYGISPMTEHYGCMVDLLSRSGRTLEAEKLVKSMPMEPDGAVWGALLNGCVKHGHAELAEGIGRNLINVEPQHSGRYVGLANAYCSMGNWESASKVRNFMKKMKVAAEPAGSLVSAE